MLACRLQEQAFGSLDRESLRFLDGLARHGGSPRRQLKPGTVLIRDYQGQRHIVTVAADGFNWQGTTYAILSPSPAPSPAPPGVVLGSSPWREATAHHLRPAQIKRGRAQAAMATRPARTRHRCSCKPPHMRNPETIGVGYASLLERLPQTCPGLLSDCAACGVLDR